MRRRSAAVAALAWMVVMAGCSTASDRSGSQPETSDPSAVSRLPSESVEVLTGTGAAVLAVEASQALYQRAPVVVLAAAAEPDRLAPAAERAVELGVPLLLVPGAGGSPPPGGEGAAGAATEASDGPDVGAELARLGTGTVLAYGADATGWAAGQAGLTVIDGAGPPGDAPPVTPPEPLSSLTVLAAETEESAAAVATARAAGARVLSTGATDPRTDPEVIEALAAAPPTHTLALGAGFGPVEQLRARLAVATTGVQLPGGGQVVYPGRRMVALYGHPGNPGLGVLGEQPRDQTINRAREVAAEYEELVDEPVVPTLEIITTIASASPGPEGDYSRRTPVAELRDWVDAAGAAGVYVVLDLQPGHTDFLTQAKEYEELLREPHVGLALDPEWRLAPGERHLADIGSVAAAEVNQVIGWLADLTAEHHLPQKLLIGHQFQLRMISDRDQLDTGRDEVAVLLHADGFGTPSQKLATWEALRAGSPETVWWGWKNFYDEDQPTFTPEETVALDPSPLFISYQ